MNHILFRDLIVLSLFITLLASFTSCGHKRKVVYENTTINGVMEDSTKIVGLYYFEHGGEIEILQDQYNRLTVTHFDAVTSINPENSTFAVHPRTNLVDKFLTQDTRLLASIDVVYNSGHGLENDTTGANITGKKRTDFEYKWEDGELVLTIKVFSDEKNDNPNTIIATRVLRGNK